jgi:hypothetical protein
MHCQQSQLEGSSRQPPLRAPRTSIVLRLAAMHPVLQFRACLGCRLVSHAAVHHLIRAEFSNSGNNPYVGMSKLDCMLDTLRAHIGTLLAIVGVILWTIAIVDWCCFDHFLNSWWWR